MPTELVSPRTTGPMINRFACLRVSACIHIYSFLSLSLYIQHLPFNLSLPSSLALPVVNTLLLVLLALSLPVLSCMNHFPLSLLHPRNPPITALVMLPPLTSPLTVVGVNLLAPWPHLLPTTHLSFSNNTSSPPQLHGQKMKPYL